MKKELLTYLLIGVGSVLVDCLSYFFLLGFLPTSFAKIFSYIAGMFFGFICNRKWTFKSINKMHHDVVRVGLVYLGSLLCNVMVNEMFISISHSMVTFAFIVATGVSIITNYLGQKYWVYKK